MSSPIDPDHVPQQVKDGFVAAILGGLAMTARLLLSDNPVSAGWVFRRVLAASITALFVGFFLQDHVSSVPLRYALIGACGYSAPEVADCAAKWIRAKMQERTKAEIRRSRKSKVVKNRKA